MGQKIDTIDAELLGTSLGKTQETPLVLVTSIRIPDLFGFSPKNLMISVEHAVRLRDQLNRHFPVSQFPVENPDV